MKFGVVGDRRVLTGSGTISDLYPEGVELPNFYIHLYSPYRKNIGGGTGGRGGSCPHLQTRGSKRYQIPPFRRLSGMMPASIEKTGIYK